MTGHTVRTSAIDTVKETTNIGSIWVKCLSNEVLV